MPETDKSANASQQRKSVVIHACLLAAVAIGVYVGFYFLVGSR